MQVGLKEGKGERSKMKKNKLECLPKLQNLIGFFFTTNITAMQQPVDLDQNCDASTSQDKSNRSTFDEETFTNNSNESTEPKAGLLESSHDINKAVPPTQKF